MAVPLNPLHFRWHSNGMTIDQILERAREKATEIKARHPELMFTSDTKICPICDREYKRRMDEGPANWARRHYCSSVCAATGVARARRKPAPTKICEVCGREFPKARSVGLEAWDRQRYCSRECYGKTNRASYDVTRNKG